MKLENIIYAKLNIDFDQDLFVKEYDEYILPRSRAIANGIRSWELTKPINEKWNMVPTDVYDTCNVKAIDSSTIIERGVASWMATSMLELQTDNTNYKEASKLGSVALRNTLLNSGEYFFKPEYENLKITDWIKSLPFSKLIGIRCVSLAPNTFASIHRDNLNFLKEKGGSLNSNKLWNSGFISITLNLTDGGSPIFYSLDSDTGIPYKVNDKVYMFNDYFFHGVPLVTSRRRQIRITGIPTRELNELIEKDSIHLFDNVLIT